MGDVLTLAGVVLLFSVVVSPGTWILAALWYRQRRQRQQYGPIYEELKRLRAHVEGLQEHLAELTLALEAPRGADVPEEPSTEADRVSTEPRTT